MKISAIVLSKDNEKSIKKTIDSLQWCSEVIVVDDYSSDRTVQIARKLGARVNRRALENDFAKQRNFGFKKARGEWILFIDSDEVVTKALKKEITSLLDTSDFNGFYINRQDVIWGKRLKYGESGGIKLIRLAKKNSGVWRRKVHEYWEVKGRVGLLSNPLLHYPHPTVKEFTTQINFHSNLHSQMIKKEGKSLLILKIIFFPLFKFINNFIFRGGFLDGIHGFVAAMMMSFHSFLSWSKLWRMSEKKPLLKIHKKNLIFLYLVIFPLGQLVRFSFRGILVHPADLVMGMIFLMTLLDKKIKYPALFSKFLNFLTITLFSLLVSLAFFNMFQIMTGFLYFLRFASYVFFFVYLANFVRQEKEIRRLLVNSLLLVGVVVAIFGWIQYFTYPDFRPFTEFGWDDHLFRLVGTFFDPAFTGIILVLTFILSFSSYLMHNKRNLLYLSTLLLISVAFTYSRSSYLALVAGSFFTGFLFSKVRTFVIFMVVFAAVIFLLPRPSSSGVQLERTYSIVAKGQNYSQSWELIKRSPLIGIGFNNTCVAKQKFLGETNKSSHSCGGLDNSFLLVLATTGVIGTIVFGDLVFTILKNTSKNYYGVIFISSVAAITIHTMFTNTLFYPWIMGWSAILLAVSRRKLFRKVKS